MSITAAPEDAPAAVVPPPSRQRRGSTVYGAVLGLVVLVAGLALPHLVSDPYTLGLALEAALTGLLALGIGFLARHLGLISLGHTAFFGGAAYGVGIAVDRWGWGLTRAVVFGVVVGTVLALVIGALVVRSSGMGFLMLTLALSQALAQLAVQTSLRPWTGAHDGLLVNVSSSASFLGLGPASLQNAGLFWPVAWVSLMVCALALWLVGRSRFGVLLEGIRENEERMRFSGYNTFLPRLAAFVLSGFVASVGGALLAINTAFIAPDILGFSKAGDSLIAVLVGGPASLAGPLVGTGLYVWAEAHLNVGGNLHLFTGIALIAVLVFLPGGLTGAVGRATRAARKAAHR